MSTEVHPLPPPPACLTRSYESRGIKGGTVIAEDVVDLETHKRRVVDPDGYRAAIPACLSCGRKRIHAHCFRERILRAPGKTTERALVVEIRLYRCAARSCGGVFTVLPAFVARHLWRAWRAVEASCAGKERPPRSTLRRWMSRLASDAAQLAQSFTALGPGVLGESVLGKIASSRTRWEVLGAAQSALALPGGQVFSATAAWIHKLVRGIRLM